MFFLPTGPQQFHGSETVKNDMYLNHRVTEHGCIWTDMSVGGVWYGSVQKLKRIVSVLGIGYVL